MKIYENLESLNLARLQEFCFWLDIEYEDKSKKDILDIISSINFNKIDKHTIEDILIILDIHSKKLSKRDMIEDILFYKYEIIKQLGKEGKDGITYLVKDKKGNEYALKKFKDNKFPNSIKKEVELQKLASKEGICPKIIDFDTTGCKYIVMEKLDDHLTDKITSNKGVISKRDQKQLISIFKKLDKAGVFHADSNALNYMFKGGKLYIIDFGMSKRIDDNLLKELNTKQPNMDLMLLGFILKLKERNCPEKSYSVLLDYLDREIRRKFNL